jgi:alpha-L-rhamnosidase
MPTVWSIVALSTARPECPLAAFRTRVGAADLLLFGLEIRTWYKITCVIHRLTSCILLLLACGLAGQESGSRLWEAHWISVPGAPPHGYGVYHFRKTFNLSVKPETFLVDVSADNRYQLYVNGKPVSFGPARGDLTHWRYETVDLAPHLEAGKNALAAVVWNDGPHSAVAQVSNETGFVLHAEAPENALVNTNATWKCAPDPAYSPLPLPADQRTGYYALGANEKFDAAQYPWGWEARDFDDSPWPAAHELSPAAPRFARDAPNRWMLVPREIPLEEQTPERLKHVRKATGVVAADAFLQGGSPIMVPANSAATLLVDQSYLTTAFPEISVSGGAGSTVNIRYAETLFDGKDAKDATKSNRNDVDGKIFLGPADTYLSDGSPHRVYRPLFWRTYRYIQLEIKTAAQPLTIEDLRGTSTGYPFQRKAEFHLPDSPADAQTQQILTTGFRTARLCAHETYMDCPFYEQLQYAGDARIQMMVSIYMTGDSRLMKNGISLLNSSRTAEGATYSRAPSELQQYIPPFSLWWIGMVHDYRMYVDDPAFVKEMLPGVRSVLAFYARYQKPNGSLARMPWWNFVDWVKEWPTGEPPADPDGSSAAALDLQLILAYQWAADLEKELGSKALSAEYGESAAQLKATVLAADWDPSRRLFADQPSHKTFSQHVNTLAVLAHLTPREQGKAIMQKVFADSSLAQASIYFRAYTNAALREVGLGDKYLDVLGPWHAMLRQGLTTWAEWNGPDTRSDCHAWGASPNFELLRTVAGIESAAAGFERVRISPNLGTLKHVSASMPHPKGEIKIDLRHTSDKVLTADVDLPPGVSGEFVFAGLYRALTPGHNHFEQVFR